MSAFAQFQRAQDGENLLSTPMLEYDMERIPAAVGLEGLGTGSTRFRTWGAVIMEVADTPNRLIKYQTNCPNTDAIHPLVRDFALLKKVQPALVTPVAFFVSPPALFSMPITEKTSFHMNLEQRLSCAGLPGAHVRYMVMERAGLSADDWMLSEEKMGRSLEVSQVIRFMANLIRAVQKIHEHGVIHGDIHLGNVVRMDRAGVVMPGLIDFGKGSFTDELVGKSSDWYVPMANTHCYLTHWRLLGFRGSFRDDVFMAVLVGAIMLNRDALFQHCKELETDANAMLNFKSQAMWFTFPGLPNRLAQLRVPESVKQILTDAFARVQALSRSVTEIDALPPYEEIYTELITSVDLLDASLSKTHFRDRSL